MAPKKKSIAKKVSLGKIVVAACALRTMADWLEKQTGTDQEVSAEGFLIQVETDLTKYTFGIELKK